MSRPDCHACTENARPPAGSPPREQVYAGRHWPVTRALEQHFRGPKAYLAPLSDVRREVQKRGLDHLVIDVARGETATFTPG
jgi:hypothetical protein